MFGTLRRAAEGSEDSYAFIETAPHGGGGFVACRRCRARKVRKSRTEAEEAEEAEADTREDA